MNLAQMYLLRTAETTSHSIKSALVLLEATHMVMEQSQSPEQYLDGLFALWDYLDDLAENLQGAADAVYQNLKEG